MKAQDLEAALRAAHGSEFEQLCVLELIDSTNAEALRRLSAGQEARQLIVAQCQSAGRGRRGRRWLSPPGAGLYVTLTREFSVAMESLQALSLVTAISVREALVAQGLHSAQLKWPNDILVAEKKLAGILLETCQWQGQPVIIFGIGINLDLPAAVLAEIDRPVTDLRQALAMLEKSLQEPAEVDQAALLSTLVTRWQHNVEEFLNQGFAPFTARWNDADCYAGREVIVSSGAQDWQGQVLGVDEQGALLLDTPSGTKVIRGGEVLPTLRPLADA